MADLVADTGQRGENVDEKAHDPQKVGQGHAQSPGGAGDSDQSTRTRTAGQESYPGDRSVGETDRPGEPSATDRDGAVNNALTPEAGDIEPGSNDSALETGQAGVNDRPGKDKGHPWNG